RGDRAVVDAVPAAAGNAPPVHLRYQERPVGVDRLDIGDVALRRAAADAHHHDGAGPRGPALSEAEASSVPPPLIGIPPPGDGAFVGDPPGAVAGGKPVGRTRSGAGNPRWPAAGDSG